MVRIDCVVFGYRKLKILPENLSEATSIMLRASITSRINADGTVTVRERDFAKISGLFKGRFEFECSEPLGIPGKYKRLKNKSAYIAAILVSIVIISFLSNLVWDIRIEGNLSIPDSEIKLGLAECGLSIGDLWPTINRSNIESKYLATENNISWININRRGSVAYVKIIENQIKEEEKEELPKYSNIVASHDCVIEEITVRSGTAVVKKGDTVKKGDILIMGVLPQELGGGFCSADGSVIGRINEKISINVNRKYEKIIGKNKKLYSITLNFFKISINIFKLYRNLTDKCDIIDNEKTYSLFGISRLPFSVSIKYLSEYEYAESEYTDEELVRVASSRLDALTVSRLCRADLLKIRTYGEFEEDGYKMRSEMSFLSDVSERVEFKVE